MFFFDSNYLVLVLIPTLVISLLSQMYVRSAFSKWGQVRNSSGLTGAQGARQIMTATSLGQGSVRFSGPQGQQAAGAYGIRLERVAGQFTDHYDPTTHTVRMSDSTANQPSVAAMAVVAHELGHAQQHEQNSILIQLRSFLVPAVRFSPTVSYLLIVAGFFFAITELLWLGIAFFGITVVFMVLTLPVEFDASRRGLALLRESGLMQSADDQGGSRQVLTAAALTYVAAAVTAVLQLLYYISLAQRRR
jgi:Zn-dependent membrane protease YugP